MYRLLGRQKGVGSTSPALKTIPMYAFIHKEATLQLPLCTKRQRSACRLFPSIFVPYLHARLVSPPFVGKSPLSEGSAAGRYLQDRAPLQSLPPPPRPRLRSTPEPGILRKISHRSRRDGDRPAIECQTRPRTRTNFVCITGQKELGVGGQRIESGVSTSRVLSRGGGRRGRGGQIYNGVSRKSGCSFSVRVLLRREGNE